MIIYTVGANLTINQVAIEEGRTSTEICNEGFTLLIQGEGHGQYVSDRHIKRLRTEADILLGFMSQKDTEEFIETQNQSLGNLAEQIITTLTKGLRDKYIVFGAIKGWIHGFKMDPKEGKVFPQRLLVCICFDDAERPLNSYLGSDREHAMTCGGAIFTYPFIPDPLAIFEPFEKFDIFETKAAYLASIKSSAILAKGG